MMKKLLVILLCAVLLCACTAPVLQAPLLIAPKPNTAVEADYQVGYGRMSIVPDHHMALGGHSNAAKRISTEILDPLYATAVAITGQNGDSIVLITVDFCQSNWEYMTEARSTIAANLGLRSENIVIAGTHTHSGPAIEIIKEKEPEYLRQLIGNVVKAAEAAWADRCGAEFYISKGQTEGLTFVRHYLHENGQVDGPSMPTVKDSPIVGHTRDADGEVRLLHFKRQQGKDVVLMNFQVHATLNSYKVSEITQMSADIVGGVRAYMEAELDCHFAYFQGAAGDLNPDSHIPGEHSTKNIYKYGALLGGYAVDAMANETRIPAGDVKANGFTMGLPVDKSDMHMLEDAKKVKAYRAANGDTATYSYAWDLGFVSFHHAESIISRSTQPDSRTVSLNALQIGPVGMVTAPFELFSDTGVDIRNRSPYDMTFVLGYANGYWAYLPSRHAFTEYYSYEAGVCRFGPGAAELLADEYVKQLNVLKEGK